MYERFNESARAVMVAANREAIRVKHEYIGTDDILVGLAVGELNLATKVLAAHVDVETLRKQFAAMPKTEGDPKTPRAKNVFERAMSEARKLFHLYIGPEHLLLGLLHDTQSDASRALIELKIDLDQLRSEILNQLPPGSPEEVQNRQAIQSRFADHLEVKNMMREIKRLQSELENAVVAKNFELAASLRVERMRVEQSLIDLYHKLSED